MGFTGRVWVAPAAGTVRHGMGTVWENPTRGLPVLNPMNLTYNLPVQNHLLNLSFKLNVRRHIPARHLETLPMPLMYLLMGEWLCVCCPVQ